MNIILKSLELDNFAGSGKEQHTFLEKETTVSADNGRGKTRLANAFIWLLFDKNTEDRKDFNIKNTFDLAANRQEHIVSAVLNVNGSDISLKKIYKEKWVKKQGSKTQEMTGNETIYFYDDVPVNKGEYKAKIDSLVNEDIFKLLTNVSFFNKMPWLKQRSIILGLAPTVTDNDVAETNPAFKELLASLTNGKTLAEYKTQISAQKKKLNDLLKGIPVRIDEVKKSMPEAEDFDQIETDIYDKETAIKGIEQEITGGQEQFNKLNQNRQAKQQIINDLKLEKQNLEFQLSQAATQKQNDHTRAKVDCRNNISNTEKDIANSEKEAKRLVEKINNIDVLLAELRESFISTNASEIKFDENQFKCPTCGTEKSPEEAEENKVSLTEQFNKNKVMTLDKIEADGMALNAKKEELKQELANANRDFEAAKETLEGFKTEFLQLTKTENAPVEPTIVPQEIIDLDAQIEAAIGQLDVVEPIDQSELISRKEELKTEIDSLKIRLNNKAIIEEKNKRISELEAQESEYSQQVFDLEGIEFTITEFDKAKITTVENLINSKFEKVKFKLFDTQVNGAEVPCCEATIDGVPYSDANTANKIIAGLDVIKTLSKEYDVKAPIFIDNSESITQIDPMDCQIIKLQVLAGQNTLSFS